MVMTGVVDFTGLALTALSVAVPAILSVVFYIIVAAAPGGIRRGSHGHCRLLQRTGQRAPANNHVKPDAPEAVPDETVEEVIEEVVEEVVAEDPPEATANFVEEIPEVAHPEPAVQSSRKKKKNKNKAKETEEVVEEIEPAVETVEVAEEDLPLEEPAADEELPVEASGENVDTAAVTETEQVEAEQAEEDVIEAVEANEEAAQEEKGKKKKKKKGPKAAFLLAQQFRCGVDVPEEPATVKAEFELDPSILLEEGDDGDWVTLTKKEKKDPKAEKKEEEVEAPEPTMDTEAHDEEVEEVEETIDETPNEEEDAADEDQPEDDVAADDVVAEEEAEKDDEDEDDEDAIGDAGAAAEDAGEVPADEEVAEGQEEDEEDADDEDGEDGIDVPFKSRLKVRDHKKMIQFKAGVKSITEIGGTFTVKGPRAARKEALNAIESIYTKGYTLLSYANPKESKLDVQAGKLSLLIGPKGAVINKIRDACDVEIKIPEQADVPANRSALCPVFVGGNADGVDQAAEVITEIVESGFSPLTHPGVVREERELDKFERGFVIGKGGAEVNKIKESFKVRVSVQDDKAYVTGQKKDVANAMKHIQSLLSRDDVVKKIEALREKEAREAEAAAKAAADAEAAAKAEQEEEEEEATGDNEEADGEDKEIETHDAAKDESEGKEEDDEDEEKADEEDDEDEEEDA